MSFEGGASFEQNLYSSAIHTTTFVSQTERLGSTEGEQMLREAECQLLRHQLENEQMAHRATFEDAARASCQLRAQNAALESENIRLRMALAHARQYASQHHMDIPRPHLSSESAFYSQFATASSSPTSTQSTIATITSMASMRRRTTMLLSMKARL